jgi:hypothetical protein
MFPLPLVQYLTACFLSLPQASQGQVGSTRGAERSPAGNRAIRQHHGNWRSVPFNGARAGGLPAVKKWMLERLGRGAQQGPAGGRGSGGVWAACSLTDKARDSRMTQRPYKCCCVKAPCRNGWEQGLASLPASLPACQPGNALRPLPGRPGSQHGRQQQVGQSVIQSSSHPVRQPGIRVWQPPHSKDNLFKRPVTL